MKILDGKLVSEHRRQELRQRIEQLQRKSARTPHLAVILVGDSTASVVYVRNKEKACESVGIKSTLVKISAQVTEAELIQEVEKLNRDSSVHGVLIQLPLPKHIDEKKVLNALSPLKDADGLTTATLGRLWAGVGKIAPCTPQGVMSILKHYGINPAGLEAVVVGRSEIVGKPMAHLLMAADATVTICHSKTKNLSEHTRRADIVVVAAGKREMLGRDDFKKGAIVIDVGIHGTGSGQGLTGDVRFKELDGWASAATPVPGGVGPMTITTLLENTVTLAEQNT